MIGSRAFLLPATLLLAACNREQAAVDPQLAAEIAGIKAIDNHAHPVLAAPGDREFDALPVDHMERSRTRLHCARALSRRRSPASRRPRRNGSTAINTPRGCWI
jgi:hypothetical protein